MSEPPARYFARLLGDPSTPDAQLAEAWVEAQSAKLFVFGVDRYAHEGRGIVVMDTQGKAARDIQPSDEFTMIYVPIAQIEAGIGVWSSPLGLVGLEAARTYTPPTEVVLMVLYQGGLYGPYLVERLIDPSLN